MKKLKDVVGFRPKQPLKNSQQDAMDATDCNPASLVEQCVERALPGVVRDILALRKAAAEKFLRYENGGKTVNPRPDTGGLIAVEKPRDRSPPKPPSKPKPTK